MSVWDSLVGQQPVIDMLSRIAQGDPSQIAQSWLICGPPGSGRSNMARAFAAALESPDHGMSDEPTRVTQQVLAGTHPDVTVLATNKVTIARASDAVLLAGNLIDNAKAQAEVDASRTAADQEAEFRRINGLEPGERIPPKLRGAFNQIAKKDDLKRLTTRRTRDVLDRALNSIASIYRDVAVLQNNAEDSVGLINLENRSAITELSVRLNRAGAVARLDEVAHARKRLAGNGNPLLVFESLFCALIP